MNTEKLNQWLTLIANVGVLIGIIFLALEMSQNTSMMQAQIRQGITENTTDFLLGIGTNLDASTAFYRGRSGIRDEDIELPPGAVERSMWGLMIQANFRLWENEWYQYQKSLFEESEIDARKNVWANLISTNAGYLEHWELSHENYSLDFGAEIDRILAELQ
jgi:hypothetical protein